MSSITFKLLTGSSMLFRWCVPVFFMISGALFLSPNHAFSIRKLFKKTIPHIAAGYVFWSSVYAAAHCAVMGKGKWTFLNQFLRGHYHMWFILAIFGLYLLTPLLRQITLSRKMTEYALGVGFLFLFLLPRTLSLIVMMNPPHADVFASLQALVSQSSPLPGTQYLFYFLLGHYLHEYTPGRKASFAVYICGAIGLVLTLYLSFRTSQASGQINTYFYGPDSMTILMTAASIFLLFRRAFDGFAPKEKAARVIETLSVCSFGVYLVHLFVIERTFTLLPAASPSIIPFIPLIALIMYVLSVLMILIIRRIPVIGRMIT
jgi:surface polysaccharide O-acyltransferase-like enzyme